MPSLAPRWRGGAPRHRSHPRPPAAPLYRGCSRSWERRSCPSPGRRAACRSPAGTPGFESRSAARGTSPIPRSASRRGPDEHQDRQRELESADRVQARHASSFQYCMLPWHQRRSRRITRAGSVDFLPAAGFIGQDADLVAGTSHQRGFNLVVAQYMAATAACRADRQRAMCDERREADDGVVAPVGPAIALPEALPGYKIACSNACRTGRCG